jgi:hypothetical protein
MEAPETKLETKLVQLQMTVSRTEKALKTGGLQAIERQQVSLIAITTEIDLLRGKVEVKKITDKENPEEIENWVGAVSEQRQILAKHRLCFNCTRGNHRAAECPSK